MQAERTAQLQRTIEFFTDIDGILAPPSRQSLSEWSDKNRILPRTAAEPGIWRTAKTPYMRSIMDAYSDPSVQRIVVMGASQIGKTESLILNAIAFHIDQDPCDILLVLPTQDALERLSKKRLGALFRDTECIRSKVSAAKSRSGDATLYYRGYDGGSITLASPVPSQLAGDPYRVLLLDEIDRYATTREGDPIELAIKRASTFWNRKIVLISSPTSEETSRILAAYRHSTREEYHVPCPICDRLQVLSWDRIEFGPPIRHRCEHCQGLSEQHEWAARSQFGKWVARNPGHRTRGFHINALVSPWIEWDDLRREFLDAVALMKVGDFSSMQVFRNTRMAEPWGPPGEKLDVEELWQRREIYEAEVPAGVLLITAGVDIQDGRIVAEVAGWGVDRERWALGYHIFYGNTLEADVWCELAELLDKDFVRADGVKLQILKMFVDSGRHASVVYRWTKPRQPRAFSIKGRGGPGLPIIASKSQVKDGSYATLVSLGSDSIKDQMQIRLNQQEPGPIFCHYPKLAEGGADRGYDEEYFDGLCSEKCVTRYRGGQPVPSWEKTAHASNEPLDCFCYGFAALEFAGGLSALQRAATAIETMIRPPTTVGSGSPGSPFGSVPNRNPREHERPRGWAPGARPSSEESESPFGTYRPKSGRGH